MLIWSLWLTLSLALAVFYGIGFVVTKKSTRRSTHWFCGLACLGFIANAVMAFLALAFK